MSVFQRLTEVPVLATAWDKVKANGGGPGGDGQTLGQFESGLQGRLASLSDEIRRGRYRPGPVRHVDIAKPSGGIRRLSVPCVRDRVAQTAVAQWLTRHLDPEFEDASYAYRPGRSVQRAVARVASLRRRGYTWTLEGDIARFFDEVPHDPLLAKLERHVGDARLIDLIGLWLEALAPGGVGLPQGAPISPVLSNLYLDELDERLDGHGVRLVRFADDFVVLCRSEKDAEQTLVRVAGLLQPLGLRLNMEKTRVVPFEKGFRFLGRLFVRSLVVEELWDDAEGLPAAAEAIVGRVDAAAAEEAAARRGAPPAGVLRPLYVVEPGASLRATRGGLAVWVEGRPVLGVNLRDVDRVELHPGTHARDDALRLCASQGVPVSLIGGGGALAATVEGPLSARGALHLAQARLILDPERRLATARAIAHGRLFNQRSLLRRLNRGRDEPFVAQACQALGRALRRLPEAQDVAAVMGVEGEAGARYHPALGALLRAPWVYRWRRRRPPPDPFNAVLSYLAALLYRDVSALIARRGLHPGFGVLHACRDHTLGLASDLVEEFRAPLVEGLAVYLVNNRILGLEGFGPGEDDACAMTQGARRTLIGRYEAWLDRPVVSPASGHKVSWRGLIRDQVNLFAGHLEGGAYVPYALKN
ncbi:CRISPR-associated endonuclease Cas1 [Roseospirillum parvum]|uniref:CRISPR-associated endonuclease Cas1 n=1 Tax=Roseospirillum parvum TaxID=83401 RepID=A0A1G8FCD0_9PROT|nr:CRISPR-associated endonuclease Cas1 [Roseospirillum parvum]SDH79790.1 CRISP-associated protein Cas1 [Roseospirillum parvum]